MQTLPSSMGKRSTRKSLAFSLSLFVGLFSLSASAEAPPKIHDGLNSLEEQRAMRTLDAEISQQASVNSGSSRFSVAQSSLLTAPSDPQLLLMERRRVKGSSQRLADAWYYSYTYNETTHKIIDLATGQVMSSEVVIGTQLPLIDAEVSRAFDVLLASDTDRLTLEKAYREVTGEQFTDRSQVSFKAFVFHPETVVDGLSPDARRCGVNRCAQMLIYTHDNIALDTSPVVDLSTSRVLQNLELRAQAIVRREEAAL